MTQELAPGAVDTDDTFLVLIVPEDGISDVTAPTVTELTAGTVKKVTYSLTTSGWNWARSQDSGTDDRLTLASSFETQGKIKDSLELQYVYGSEDDVADPLLVKGFKGYAVARYAVPNSQDIAAGDVVDVIPFEAGPKRKDAPTANAKWTKTQKLFVRAPGTQDDVAVVAGS